MPAVQMRTLAPRGATTRAQADVDNQQQCQDVSPWSLTWSPLPRPGAHKDPYTLPEILLPHTLEILLLFLHSDRVGIVLRAYSLVSATDPSFYL